MLFRSDAPIAENDAYSVDEDEILVVSAPGVLANDEDADSTVFTLEVISDPTSGTADLNDDGSFTYTPNANFFGSDSFTYSVADDDGATDTATVIITITAVDDAPIAENDAYSVDEDETLVVSAPGVVANDEDADSTVCTLEVISDRKSGV